MKPSRAVATAAVVGLALTSVAAPVRAQGTPKLSKTERQTLQAVVAAVDAASPTSDTAASWQTHLLRASDGSHYVALRALAKHLPAPTGPVVLYVRLASRHDRTMTSTPERSAVREWLKGERSDPLPMRAGGSMSVPRGEMPVGSIIPGGRDVAAESVAALRLMMMEHEKTKKRRAEQEAARRAELEDATRQRRSPMMPFEDFDVAATFVSAADGRVDVRRSVTAGPGDYDLTIAWADAPARGKAPPVVRVLSHRLILPAARGAFELSDVIVAETVTPITSAYGAAEQNAHPYAIGTMEFTPAPGNVLRADGTVGLVVQAINPTASESGKPDVSVAFRIARLVGDREEHIGTLPVQRYDVSRLPVDFDVAKGHPLLVAARASLATFARGRYRVTAVAHDHLSDRATTSDAIFDVTGTPTSLLREAPRLSMAFERGVMLSSETLATLVKALTPLRPSETLTALLTAARNGQFALLVRDSSVEPTERATALALRALGLYGLGDAPSSIGVPLQAATSAGVPEAPMLALQGAVHALAGDDAAAIAAWQKAHELGLDAAAVGEALLDAYLRRGDPAKATAMATALRQSHPDNVRAAKVLVATHLAAARAVDALALLDARPLADHADEDTRFLLLHALYATLVSPSATGPTSAARARFESAARTYVEQAGPHAALVAAWQKALADE